MCSPTVGWINIKKSLFFPSPFFLLQLLPVRFTLKKKEKVSVSERERERETHMHQCQTTKYLASQFVRASQSVHMLLLLFFILLLIINKYISSTRWYLLIDRTYINVYRKWSILIWHFKIERQEKCETCRLGR